MMNRVNVLIAREEGQSKMNPTSQHIDESNTSENYRNPTNEGQTIPGQRRRKEL
jgi:hypothetical protein